jgi:hypothetical protein
MDLTDDPLAGIDANELEADIDKAIDELFVKKGEAPEPVVAEEVATEAPAAEPAERAAPIPAAEPEFDPLAQLKENLLTLDWEITAENILSFEKELQAVKDKLGDDRHSMAVIKMGLGVLQYLRVAKGSAAPISIQFLHAATRGLDLFVKEPAPTDAERNQVMDKLLGQFRRLKAEIQRMKPAAAPAAEPAVEAPPPKEYTPEEIPEEEPILEELLEEEPGLEELIEEEPIFEELPEAELSLKELSEEEPIFEELPEAELSLKELSEEEPILEKLPEEDLSLDELSEEEPIFEELPEEDLSLDELSEEEPILEKLPEEELRLDELPEVEPLLAEPPEEEPLLEELPEVEPAIEPPLEPAGITLAPAVPSAEVPTAVQQFTQKAKEQIGQLSNALEDLGHETGDFFNGVMSAMAGKPALEKVVRHFSTCYKAIEGKLADAKELSVNAGKVLAELDQSLDQQQTGALAPGAQAAIDSQVKIIQDAVERFTQAAAHLRQSLTGTAAAPPPSARAESHKDIGVDTEEFSLEPEEAVESLGYEPLLDLVEEVPPEDPDKAPSPATTIYLADVANNTLGIPTEAVVSVFKTSKRTAKAFRQRGYAKLADFKGAFRSIKRGISGPLADLKVKDLKKIQFPIITLSPEILGSDDIQTEAPVKGIVLLSNGERHGALVTDEIMQRTPYEVKGYRKAGLPGEVSGTAIIEGDFEINVIDPDYVLS